VHAWPTAWGSTARRWCTLSARAFAVVDVWDALTSDRPYRRAWTPERAHLLEQRGQHFDPEAVDAFLALLDDG
jgi:HD-GYP domain-containing protein (c-di-GMP phosphodiesterase class II)